MLHLLFDWEYPHWLMMAGAILVALGFIGFAFHRNRNGATNKPLRTPRRYAAHALFPPGAAEQRPPPATHRAPSRHLAQCSLAWNSVFDSPSFKRRC
jgi:hypothetical protein